MNEALSKALNDQMNFEFYSAQVYLAMAAYCSSESFDGFANFFIVQAEEERFHAMKIYKYLNDRGGRVMVSGMDTPNNTYKSILEAYEHAYEHEKIVTKRFYDLSDLAMNDREHATIHFLKWFIDEQVEEEALFDSIVQKLKRIDKDSNAFFMLDTEFLARTFTPPAQ
ncbi:MULTISPECIES: ferritin [unclassified Paenibacillus]|uniref:ferritin n=1 Tax=unclassified Paenibacillus TaxID=185978 RepID=UPI001AE24538|nr:MULTISPECIES: ferritin [unclassified Paenibacillus]MBP1156829.1 ferritin [Paenibacillus sp. PvP091]MBP1172432.1 ferritin [Paenibacillus sp. PvR098]MBP2438813.1 ferritin [Paenibacillus sp. PvP052]